jgi:alpha-ribazole phosphatase
MKTVLIRHGKTQGNIDKRYSGGGTDDPLSDEGRAELCRIEADPDSMIFISPMIRARQTADILFPDQDKTVIEGLREMHFGLFEGRTHWELDGDPVYQAWIDSMGELRIPDAEDREAFIRRSMDGLREALETAKAEGAKTVYLVCHGGTAMSVMMTLFGGAYYDYHPHNGCGYTFEAEVDDAGNVVAAGTYDSFCGGVLAGSPDR